MTDILPIGTNLSYGLWDRRQVPVKVAKLNKDKLPNLLVVTETIPNLCKKGAEITLEDDFWLTFQDN